jgi:hypothetical protein
MPFVLREDFVFPWEHSDIALKTATVFVSAPFKFASILSPVYLRYMYLLRIMK